jgi:hypothetical protein
MKPYQVVHEKIFNVEYFNELVNIAFNYLKENINNNEIIIEKHSSVFNFIHNDKQGVFINYRILNDGKLIGYLNTFRTNELDYLIINTVPISN